MKGGFFAGIALGALMGAMMLELNPQTKQAVKKGQDILAEQVQNATKWQGKGNFALFFW